MPLNVSIALNGRPITHFHIGRLSGDTSADSINTYAVLSSNQPDDLQISNADWLAAPRFEHIYGDGAERCVQLALQAYLNSDETAQGD